MAIRCSTLHPKPCNPGPEFNPTPLLTQNPKPLFLMVLPKRSIANVVSKLFQRISSKKLFARKSENLFFKRDRGKPRAKAKKRARHVLHPLILGLHTRSIANVVSKLFQRISYKKLFCTKIGKLVLETRSRQAVRES